MQQWWPVLRDLIRVPSVRGREHGAVAVVARELERRNIPIQRIEFDANTLRTLPAAQPPTETVPGRTNLIAVVRGSANGRSLIVNSHLDTVPAGDAGWDHPPFEGVLNGSKMYGRGAYDDKAGVVICLELLARAQAHPLQGDLIAHFVLEDETTGNGSLLCLEQGPTADAAIIVDGTRGDRAIDQHAGNVSFEVGTSGQPASVSVSHLGINAAETLAALVLELKQAIFALNAARPAPWDCYPSPNQFSVMSLNCPETPLTVPESASAICYATFTPPHRLSTFKQFVESCVDRFAETQHIAIRPAITWNRFATEPVKSNAAALEPILAAAAGGAIPFVPSTGTSDLRHFADRGIPCILFGPGHGHNPHRANEVVDLDSVTLTMETLWRFTESWTSTPNSSGRD